jgi:hypothetical protein
MAKQSSRKTGDLASSPKPRYINPFTDFGFKRIFGTEANKDLLMVGEPVESWIF